MSTIGKILSGAVMAGAMIFGTNTPTAFNTPSLPRKRARRGVPGVARGVSDGSAWKMSGQRAGAQYVKGEPTTQRRSGAQ